MPFSGSVLWEIMLFTKWGTDVKPERIFSDHDLESSLLEEVPEY